MITVISLNSTIDQVYQAKTVLLNEGNRIEVAYRGAGGKSINVAKVLHTLNIPVRVYGFVAGAVGELIRADLKNKSIVHDFIEVSGSSRFCTTILAASKSTELLEPGHSVNEQALNALYEQCAASIPDTTYFVLSGSLPQGMPIEAYEQFLHRLKSLNKPIILDTSNEALRAAYAFQPMLLKPNEQEFQQLTNLSLSSIEEYKAAMRSIKKAPLYLIVSLGSAGALLKHEQTIFYAQTTQQFNIVNTVGSGDSFLAAFVAGLYTAQSTTTTLKMAMAAGVANARHMAIAEIDLQHYNEALSTIVVTEEEV